MGLSKRGFLRAAWSLAWPYWSSDEKWSAGGLLAAVVALNLVYVWLTVRLNMWNNDFYNALQNYDWAKFWWQFAVFGMIACAIIVVLVYQSYLQRILHIRWRRWMTHEFLSRWLSDRAYYHIQLDQTDDRQPGPAHFRRSRPLHRHQPRSVARPAQRRRHAVLVPVHPVAAVGAAGDPAGRRARAFRSRATGVRGDHLRGRRHAADAFDRPSAGAAEL